MSSTSFTNRRPAILAAFRKAGGSLTIAELAVPDVGGAWWRQELHAMRSRGDDLHEGADGTWHLVDDLAATDDPAPADFDFTAQLRAITARGRALNETHGVVERAHPAIEFANELPTGHVLDGRPVGPGGPRCGRCGARWADALLTRSCAGARAEAA